MIVGLDFGCCDVILRVGLREWVFDLIWFVVFVIFLVCWIFLFFYIKRRNMSKFVKDLLMMVKRILGLLNVYKGMLILYLE